MMLLQEEREILARQQKKDAAEDGAAEMTGTFSSKSGDRTKPNGPTRLRPFHSIHPPPKLNNLHSGEEVAADSKRLTEIYGRLAIIGSTSAEARAAGILNGLQFSNEMQVWGMGYRVGWFGDRR